MNYQKIDPALAGALDRVGDSDENILPVFIHTRRISDMDEISILQELGISGVTLGRSIFTGLISPRRVRFLADQPWVRSIKLGRKLHLLPE
jgi:hypothetical protein